MLALRGAFNRETGMAFEEPDFNYEEISPAEVDEIVSALKILRDRASSETIREFLQDCATDIYFLVYDIDEDFEAAA